MDGSLFYWIGGFLVLAALAISAVGIRGRSSFPSSKGQMAGVLALFGLIVVSTAAYAVANASEEQDNRNEELAHEEAAAGEDVAATDQGGGTAGQPGSPGGSPSGEAPASKATTLGLTSPDDGSTVFDPDGLQASSGSVTLSYDNPSPVTHNVALEDESGQVLGESDDVASGSVDLTLELVPGQYTYFCTIPGHREAGMEGTLEVQYPAGV